MTSPLPTAPPSVSLDLLLRDLRHTSARAASDLADWLVHLDLEGKADRTIYAYHRQLAPLLRANPDLPLEEFTHTHVNDALHLIPPRSRHITRSIINRFFDWAEKDERIDRSPMNRVPQIRHPKRRPKDIFSEAEIGLLEALPAPDGQLWTLMFGTGIRRGEARNLKRSHIDLSRERLIVYGGKGDKDRIVPLAGTVLAAIADLDLFERLTGDEFLWYARRYPVGDKRRHRDAMPDTSFERWYRRCIDLAEVRYLNPHQTRHTFGRRMQELGFSLEERQLLMGHESPSTTVRYYPAVSIEDVALKVARL